MPGIAGIIRKQAYEGLSDDLRLMVGSLRHEEHHIGGRYEDESLGLYVGWMSDRGSYSDCMPLISATKDVVLIFQGEHYSKNPGREASRNAARRDEPSASHLLDLYVESPHRFFAELDGWFSGLIADRRTGTVILFNDR